MSTIRTVEHQHLDYRDVSITDHAGRKSLTETAFLEYLTEIGAAAIYCATTQEIVEVQLDSPDHGFGVIVQECSERHWHYVSTLISRELRA